MLVAFDHPQPSQSVCPIVHLVDFKVNHEERERERGKLASRSMKKRNSLSFGMKESTTWSLIVEDGRWQQSACFLSVRADSGDTLPSASNGGAKSNL